MYFTSLFIDILLLLFFKQIKTKQIKVIIKTCWWFGCRGKMVSFQIKNKIKKYNKKTICLENPIKTNTVFVTNFFSMI